MPRVLIVDDNVDSTAALALLLGADGHAVRVVHEGAAAVAEARAFRPEIVVLDEDGRPSSTPCNQSHVVYAAADAVSSIRGDWTV